MIGEVETTGEHARHRSSTEGIALMEGESVLENRRPGWTLWWKHLGFAMLVLLVGIGGDAAAGGILVAGALFGYVVLARSKSRYIVTDERIKGKLGLVSKTTMEYRVADLRSIKTTQSVFERLIGYGTLEFRAGANNRLIWHGVPDHEQVANTVREQQRKYE